MLGNGKGPYRAIEGPTSRGDIRLLCQKFEVHFPNLGHLIQENQCSFEQRIDLVKLGGEKGCIQRRDMGLAKFKIL
jgi:hypothetical protein